MLFRYIFKLYAKHLFFILFALVAFFVFFDYILNVNKLPDATNLQLLYVSFKTMEALDILWQLSIVFAFITSWIALVKSNALVAFYSLGYKKRAVLFPFAVLFLICYILMLGLQTTGFSYAKENAQKIRKEGTLGSYTTNIFFKYNDKYVYIEFLYPLQKKAQNIRIFESLNAFDIRIINAKVAYFQEDEWLMPEVEVTYNENFKVSNQSLQNYITLKGFKPKVLENVYENATGFSISDAMNAIKLFSTQGIKTDKIRAILYNKFFIPFFGLFLMILYARKMPLHARFSNLALATTMYIIITLIVWGIFLTLYKFTINGALLPEISILSPLFFMLFFILLFNKKLSNTS